MKILAVDVGTGTQDILLFDSRVDVENSFKMVQPSPTMITHKHLKEATKLGLDVLLTGVTMGGGPSHWAAEAHIKAGYKLYATPEAARSFNDDLEIVQESGVILISDDEIGRISSDVYRIQLKDFDFELIAKAFAPFGVSLNDIDVVAVAVFDHGAAPPGYSDRQFRFDYIQERVQAEKQFGVFAFLSDSVPEIMTRMKSVVTSAGNLDAKLVLMDTAPAAVLGALQDSILRRERRLVITNVGNFHTIAFRIGNGEIEGVFEHHTGLLDPSKLDGLLVKLANGSLSHEEVFFDHGHGALMVHGSPGWEGDENIRYAVTGPRWAIMKRSRLHPYFATPFGDMMMAGCYGLIKATGNVLPQHQVEIDAALDQVREKPPWEIE